ncbi:MAG: type II secretion system protein, partial [Candidatus Saccharimonadales bacterium]
MKTKTGWALKTRQAGYKILNQGALTTVWNFERTTVAAGRSFCRMGKMSQKRTEGRGFTIIEVMIFLAVSGFMFVIAAVFINGKQDNVAFRQGMEAVASTVTNTIDTVANGEYPSLGNFTCNAGVGGQPTFTGGSTGQGSN